VFELCLFDLDDTLVRTSDLDESVVPAETTNSVGYLARLAEARGKVALRLIHAESLLDEIKAAIPGMRLGVFTRSPRSYTSSVLQKAYPNTQWDVQIAFEDVEWIKPRGHGVHAAMKQLKIGHLQASCWSVTTTLMSAPRTTPAARSLWTKPPGPAPTPEITGPHWVMCRAHSLPSHETCWMSLLPRAPPSGA
jgi:beta-phosphoglucomutase-like phosphatase (HAD superfamily)